MSQSATTPKPQERPIHRAARRMLGIDRDRMSVEEAARLAYTPTGPSIEELERGIRQIREDLLDISGARETTSRTDAMREHREWTT